MEIKENAPIFQCYTVANSIMITAELHTGPLTSFKPRKQLLFCFSVQPLITKISTLENSTKQMHRQENKQNKTKTDKQTDKLGRETERLLPITFTIACEKYT